MEKLLAIVSLGQRAYGRWLFQRLLSSLILIAGLAFIIAIMICAVLIGGLMAAYVTLLQNGMEPQVAMLIVGGGAVFIIALLVVLTLAYLRHLRRIPRTMLEQAPITALATDTLNAFVDGFMEKK